ncbi:MAG: hypothetical protein MK212_16355 [Saprospiraceae bacterium]|nr:hypothetical protein [Saprospiraceae bacterium]
MKYHAATLKKLETLFKQLDFKIRYEKGNFQAGYCVVHHQQVIVVNKFYKTEARIRCLLDILKEMDIDFSTKNLDEETQKFQESISSLLIKDDTPLA